MPTGSSFVQSEGFRRAPSRFFECTFLTLCLCKARMIARECLFRIESPLIGSLLSLVESHVLMVAEVLRHDQTLARKPRSRTT